MELYYHRTVVLLSSNLNSTVDPFFYLVVTICDILVSPLSPRIFSILSLQSAHTDLNTLSVWFLIGDSGSITELREKMAPVTGGTSLSLVPSNSYTSVHDGYLKENVFHSKKRNMVTKCISYPPYVLFAVASSWPLPHHHHQDRF